MDFGQTVVRLLEVVAFSAVNGGIAAALRGWFKWRDVGEKTVAFVVALVFTSPLIIGGVTSRDLLFMGFACIAFLVEYAGILIGLRMTRPA